MTHLRSKLLNVFKYFLLYIFTHNCDLNVHFHAVNFFNIKISHLFSVIKKEQKNQLTLHMFSDKNY